MTQDVKIITKSLMKIGHYIDAVVAVFLPSPFPGPVKSASLDFLHKYCVLLQFRAKAYKGIFETIYA